MTHRTDHNNRRLIHSKVFLVTKCIYASERAPLIGEVQDLIALLLDRYAFLPLLFGGDEGQAAPTSSITQVGESLSVIQACIANIEQPLE